MPETLQFEPAWQDNMAFSELERRGHSLGQRPDVGHVQIVTVDEDGVRAASDPRKGGEAAGY